jgi:hypothetical protein
MPVDTLLPSIDTPVINTEICDKDCVIELWRDAFKSLMKWERSYAEQGIKAILIDAHLINIQDWDKDYIFELSKVAFESLMKYVD